MAPVFAEYRDVSMGEPLRQGDVIECVEEATKWTRLLLVITADCDFAFGKHQGRVTCIPLLEANDYLVEFHFPRLRDRFARKPLAELQALLRRAGGPAIRDARLREWATETPLAEIAAELELDAPDAEVATKLLRSLSLLDPHSDRVEDCIEALVASQLATPQPVTEARAREAVSSAVRDVYRQPPGDAMFLSTVGRSYESGYFAYLRHLEQIWEPDIARGPARRDHSHRRVGRLEDRYLMALVQRFAMVFMSIGLPNEYEETRDLYAEMMGGVR